jgi:hypothetical protein
MQRWESDFSGGVDEPDVPLPDSPEGRVDRFGLLTAFFCAMHRFLYCYDLVFEPTKFGQMQRVGERRRASRLL